MPESTNQEHDDHAHHLLIAGSGIYSYQHLTLETIHALEECDVVCHLATPDVAAFVETLCKKNISLGELYKAGVVNLDVYERIVEELLLLLRSHERVAYLVLGHPRLYDRSCRVLAERARAEGHAVRVLPAVSAFDALLIELDIDVGETGVQIFESNRLKIYEFPMNPSVPVLLFQLGVFGTQIITRSRKNRPERYRLLVEYLQRFYPAEHRVLVIECSLAEQHRGLRKWTTLAEIPNLAPDLNYNSTLYIPRLQDPEVVDADFERALRDVVRAESLLQPG